MATRDCSVGCDSRRLEETSMSRTSIALLLTLVLGVTSSLGCSFGEIYLTDPLLREVALADQQKHYTNLIRWSAFHKAAHYVQNERRDEFMKVAPPLKEFRFSDFDSAPVSIDESGECTVDVVYYGYRTDSPYEVEVRETQHWKRNDITNEWRVFPVFKGLDEARGRAAAN
jgi:hypothetical protein